MSVSPIEFTKSFEWLKAHIADQPAPDLRLFILVDFWSELELHADEAAYRSYFDEYVPFLLHLINDKNLVDLTIDELNELLDIILSLIRINPTGSDKSTLNDKFRLVSVQLARLYFYAGALDKGIAALAILEDVDADMCANLDDIHDLSEFHAIKTVAAKFADQSPELATILQQILSDWENAAANQDRVNCLFVEKDAQGRSCRGRMSLLRAQVDLFGEKAAADEITFDNQIRSPDDPFVGAAYGTLKAVRQVLKREGFKRQSSFRYHAHLSIAEGSHIFTGDSIGLGTGLVAYAQLLKREIMRQSRFISSEIAVTGGVGEDGDVTKVNDQTLRLKVERTFFSPVKYLIIPDHNLNTAREYVSNLRKDYPRRNLRLIGVRRLDDAIENRNIVCEERVCPLEYGAKIVHKYSKATKVQIPLLMILIYILLCLIYPKAWPGFDYHVDHIQISGNRFETINPDGHVIFTSNEFEGPLIAESYEQHSKWNRAKYIAYDLDDDGKDELVFVPSLHVVHRTHMMYLYDDDGSVIDSAVAFRKTMYPGDSTYSNYSVGGMAIILDEAGKPYVLSTAECPLPARCQVVLFDHHLKLISGPYLHTGYLLMSTMRLIDVNGDNSSELFIGGINNLCNRAALVVLDPWNLSGVSPPHDHERFIESKMQKGSQLHYVTFPETPLSASDDLRSTVEFIEEHGNSSDYWRVDVEDAYEYDHKFPNGSPTIAFHLNRMFIPERAYFCDGSWEKMKSAMRYLERMLNTSRNELLDSLLSEVIVYRGNSIVHHQASAILLEE